MCNEDLERVIESGEEFQLTNTAILLGSKPGSLVALLANGTKLEVVPKIAKTSVARDLHSKDLEDLLLVCGITNSLANIR